MRTPISLSKKLLLRVAGVLSCLGCTCLLFSSCGILGDKEEASRVLSQTNGACLDEMGPLVEDFIEGNVSESKWISTWNCVDDTIDLFKKYVQGTTADSYTPEDLRGLTQRFLFSRNTVTIGFINSLLSVKASLLGGNDQELTKDELENYRGLVRFLRDETTKLIPHLRNRKANPTAENLRNFADAVETFGNRFANYLNTSKNPTLSTDRAVLFMRELAAVGLKISPDRIENWTRFVQELKVLVIKGSESGIAGADWEQILKMGFKVGGSLIAYSDSVGEDPLFQIEMIDRIHSVLKDSMSRWGGLLPYSQLEKIVDVAPKEILPRLAMDFRLGAKKIMKPRIKTVDGKTQTFRPALSTAIASKSDLGIDKQAIQKIVDLFRTGSRGNHHLIKIYANSKEDLYPEEFESRAKDYAARIGATSTSLEVERLIGIARRYPGLHPANTPEILFQGNQEKHSLNNLKRMNWYELAAKFMLDSYGTAKDDYGNAAYLENLTLLIEDLDPILFAVGMSHPLKTEIDRKRFREANLFMPNGNGDDKMNLPETAVYLAYIFSASRQTTRVVDLTLKGANPCPILGWDVPLKQEAYDIHCFRSKWFENFKDLFLNMPGMRDDFAAMSVSEKETFYQTLEKGSKLTGYDENPMTEFDVTSYAGLPHFAEGVMQKFDRNRDGSLDRDETLDYVFPIFKRELAVVSGIKIDFVNQAVLLYLMQHGKKPDVWDLIGWAIGFEFLKKFNARRIRVYQIFAALTPPGNPDPIEPTPPPGVETDATPLGFFANSLMKGLAPPRTLASVASSTSTETMYEFDLSTVDPVQFEGYPEEGPIISPSSPYKEALEKLPQEL